MQALAPGWTALCLTLALSATGSPAEEGPADPEATYQALREMRPDGRSVAVQDLVLEYDVFRFSLASGRLHFLQPVAGRTFGAVFVGEASYELAPAIESERHLLGLLARDDKLSVLRDKFREAVFLFTDDTVERILAKSPLEAGAADAQATKAVEQRLKQQRRDIGVNFHLRILEELFNDAGAGAGVLVAFVNGARFGEVVFATDPLGVLDNEEAALLVLNSEHGGIWYSSHYREEIESGSAARCRNKLLVDAEHYEIETLVRRDEDLEGRTTVRLRVLAPRLQVLPFHILPSLRTTEVFRSGPGESEKAHPVALRFVQEDEKDDSQLAILLDRPYERGEVLELRIGYAGDEVLIDDGNGSFRVTARSSWYPNVGNFTDYATYDLTFRTPKGNTVVAVGRPVASQIEGPQLVSKWKSEQPISVAGFNYGKFELHETKVPNSEMKVEVYARRADTGGIVEPVIADAINSIQVYERLFGRLPHERLAFTQQTEWSFGQAWPGLIFMPYLSALDSAFQASDFVDHVGVHEIAHQWWGHQVGTESYRDAWLSEGFAEFSTALVLEMSQGRQAADEFWGRKRAQIFTRTAGEDVLGIAAGPVVLGFRASTHRSPQGYEDLTYGKGAYVLHMLREMMKDAQSAEPDAAFFAMMRDFLESHAGETASTADFRAVVEEHMVPGLNATADGKIDWFFDQWVYGTEIPRYEVDVDIREVGKGKYQLVGSVSQSEVSEAFLAMVPLYVDLGKHDLRLFGKAGMRGVVTRPIDVTFDLPAKPKRVVANAHNEVLSRE